MDGVARVANGGGRAFGAWTEPLAPGTSRVVGRFLAPDGAPTGELVEFTRNAGQEPAPSVAWVGDEPLVAWKGAGGAVFGRSIGKMLNGLIVARVDKSAAGLPAGQFKPPAPMRALARNIIKWFVPPVSMLVLSDPSGRHRGDHLARCAVLCRAEPPLSDH